MEKNDFARTQQILKAHIAVQPSGSFALGTYQRHGSQDTARTRRNNAPPPYRTVRARTRKVRTRREIRLANSEVRDFVSHMGRRRGDIRTCPRPNRLRTRGIQQQRRGDLRKCPRSERPRVQSIQQSRGRHATSSKQWTRVHLDRYLLH